VRALLPHPDDDVDAEAAYALPDRAPGAPPFVCINMISSLDGAVAVQGRSGMLEGLADAGLVDELCLTLSPLLVGGDRPRVPAGPKLATQSTCGPSSCWRRAVSTSSASIPPAATKETPMATTVEHRTRPDAASAPPRRPAERFTNLGDLAKFTGSVALLAILSDAAVGHALLWENDPYWTYWITKTFLIATVFGLGSAWLGAGLARGAAITAVHTLVLTVYYWSLSPIGLPSHPEWLDLEHTWVTGLPVHFGVIYLGYLVALWLWRRRPHVREEAGDSVAAEAGAALLVGGAVVAVGGALEALALGDFPGVTWFVVRLLIAVPFTLAWGAAAGGDGAAALGGGLVLAFVLVAYSHFLGPVGLPAADLRILAEDPPPSPVEWLSYRDEFLVALPITVAVAVAAYVVAATRRARGWTRPALPPPALVAAGVAVVALVGLGALAAAENGAGDEVATVTSAGRAMVEEGGYFRGTLTRAASELRLVAEQRNPRVTPLPPHDRVELTARVAHPDGTRYEIAATQPTVDDPRGRFGTWWGVGLDRWHHGRSGIGSPLLPATRSEVALFALGDVRADGEVVATGVPLHVMTMEDGGLELHVGDPASPVPSLPDGHLRVVWDERRGDSPEAPERARNALGTGVLVALLALAVAAGRAERPRADEQ
jgi:hypothetical protein